VTALAREEAGADKATPNLNEQFSAHRHQAISGFPLNKTSYPL